MTHITASRMRNDLAATLHRVATAGERIVVESDDGKEQAAIVSLDDLRLLEQVIAKEEDRMDREAARKVKAEMEATGDKGTPLEITTRGKALVVAPARDRAHKARFAKALVAANRKYGRALKKLAE